ncbi:class II aldolase/adducin family protein [Dongia deserti]|uniref:class II aldolase/adducin family protein n=1 Tax=Dongia deserti TaxID=2268030 RepID=UPI000E64BD6F|nr:class II aldolase/adducin family protein [Dongia deserti]
MNKDELELRKGIIAACRAMNSLGVNQGTSGNISARYHDVMLITPSGVPYEDLKPTDIATMPIKGEYGSWKGPLNPSSEWRFHLDIMRSRPEVGSVVHTHSTYATTLAICGKEIPAIHYMVAAAGGPNIRVAPYATYGTPELSELALKALEGRTCCLLRNHGVIATGATIKRALWLAVEIETLARQYYLSLTIGGAQILPDDEISRVVEKFKNYGPKAKPTALKEAAAKSKPAAKRRK